MLWDALPSSLILPAACALSVSPVRGQYPISHGPLSACSEGYPSSWGTACPQAELCHFLLPHRHFRDAETQNQLVFVEMGMTHVDIHVSPLSCWPVTPQ